MKPAIEVLDIPREELDALLEHARTALPEEDYRRFKAVVEGLSYLTELIADKDTTIRDLRRLLFPLLTEKTREILKRAGIEATQKSTAASESTVSDKQKKNGHGRNGADAYHGAQRVAIPHPDLHAGDVCPACAKGKVYVQQEPRRLVQQIRNRPPSQHRPHHRAPYPIIEEELIWRQREADCAGCLSNKGHAAWHETSHLAASGCSCVDHSGEASRCVANRNGLARLPYAPILRRRPAHRKTRSRGLRHGNAPG